MRIVLQIVVTAALIGVLLWYVGIASLVSTLSTMKPEYFALAFAAYFGINVLFAIRLVRVLKGEGLKLSFGKTLLAQYAGMLSSDITPGRSGYFLTPVYLRDQNVPTSKSLSGILGIQTIEFLAKVAGGVGAVIFLVEVVPPKSWELFGSLAGVNLGLLIAGLGIALMLTGALVLGAFTWSRRAMLFFDCVANSRFLKRFTGGLMGKLEEYKDSAQKTRRAVPEIILITMACWVLKGFEWYFIGYALGITQIPWIGYFLIHPLVTALAFVPLTPAGVGVQEFGVVGIFTLLGVSSAPAGVFALLSRVLLIVEDLVGVPQIAKSTSGLFLSDKPELTEKQISEPQPVKV